MRRIAVVPKPSGADLEEVLEHLVQWADLHGVELLAEEGSLPQGAPAMSVLSSANDVDLFLALGGDGTLLRAARLAAQGTAPVLGLNLGQLGFLTAAGGEELATCLDQVRAGDYELDVRFTLEASVTHADGRPGGRFLALNDFVIHKGGVARVTHIDLSVGVGDDTDEIGSFTGDGVILSTPTGSTAYSLSAGGPIIVPEVACIVVTPIAPHSLGLRPLVIPAGMAVTVRPLDRADHLVLTVDGQFGVDLAAADTVVVERGEVSVSLIRFPGQTFFSTLRKKLNWAAPPTH
jgi:NAD+ kinase